MQYPDGMTHRPRAKDPKAFRDQATGCGVSTTASAASGAARNMEVGEHMPARARAAAPEAEGFDKSMPYDGPAEDDAAESEFGE